MRKNKLAGRFSVQKSRRYGRNVLLRKRTLKNYDLKEYIEKKKNKM